MPFSNSGGSVWKDHVSTRNVIQCDIETKKSWQRVLGSNSKEKRGTFKVGIEQKRT